MPEELVLVVNPRAGAGRAARLLPDLLAALRRHGFDPDVRRTERARHATELVREALETGAPGVAVVGGDGTLNEAVNGFFGPDGAPTHSGAWLGPLPCGTGGDFRKTVGVSKDVEAMAARLASAKPRPLDAGWLQFEDDVGNSDACAFLNIASFGLGGLVDRIVNRGPKWMGGKPAFMLGTFRGLAQYRNRRVRVRVDEGEPYEQSILNVAVANGRYFGGGMQVAPEAVPDDGLFDVVAIERSGLGNLGLLKHMYGDTLLQQSGIWHTRGCKVVAESLDDEPVLLDVDGEAPGRLPATFEIRPGALQLR